MVSIIVTWVGSNLRCEVQLCVITLLVHGGL